MKNIYSDISGFDISYEEFRGPGREAFEDEDYIFIFFDRCQKKRR